MRHNNKESVKGELIRHSRPERSERERERERERESETQTCVVDK